MRTLDSPSVAIKNPFAEAGLSPVTENSFDTHGRSFLPAQIDEGWWRGWCNGQYGLFPANYVQTHAADQ